MTDREKLLEILSAPIYMREGADPAEAVADFLLDNDVLPVVRCKDCANFRQNVRGGCWCDVCGCVITPDDFCSFGERKE